MTLADLMGKSPGSSMTSTVTTLMDMTLTHMFQMIIMITTAVMKLILKLSIIMMNLNNSYNDLWSTPQIAIVQNSNKVSAGEVPQSIDVVSPLNELILKQFTNNYHLIAQKQSDTEVGLVIRALL